MTAAPAGTADDGSRRQVAARAACSAGSWIEALGGRYLDFDRVAALGV